MNTIAIQYQTTLINNILTYAQKILFAQICLFFSYGVLRMRGLCFICKNRNRLGRRNLNFQSAFSTIYFLYYLCFLLHCLSYVRVGILYSTEKYESTFENIVNYVGFCCIVVLPPFL